jgi:uncharacterized membrane protein
MANGTVVQPKAVERRISMYVPVYKFLTGFAEFSVAITIAFLGQRLFQAYHVRLLEELSEDPHDLLARLSEQVVPHVLNHNTYVVVYLLALGLAKMAGAIGLVYNKNWGVDLLVILTLLMAPFQVMSFVLNPNLFDLLYLIAGLLIAFYLVEFRPGAWVSRMLRLSKQPGMP